MMFKSYSASHELFEDENRSSRVPFGDSSLDDPPAYLIRFVGLE